MKTVLLIDDDSVIRARLKDLLEAEAIQVLEADDGKPGLELALAHHPDLIILDENMPDMDGEAVMEALRNDAWGATARVIAFTVNDDITLMNKKLQAGVTEYLDKSTLDPEELVAIILKHLQ